MVCRITLLLTFVRVTIYEALEFSGGARPWASHFDIFQCPSEYCGYCYHHRRRSHQHPFRILQIRKMRFGKMSHLPLAMQLGNGKTGIGTQDFLILDFLLSSTAAQNRKGISQICVYRGRTCFRGHVSL